MLRCPRCHSNLAVDGEATFRGAARPSHRCDGCAIWVVSRTELRALREALQHSRMYRHAHQRCPRCMLGLRRYLLSRDDRMVEVELCIACGIVVLDLDEMEAAVAIFGEALPPLEALDR